jgi:hypothetical protein
LGFYKFEGNRHIAIALFTLAGNCNSECFGGLMHAII